MAVKLIKPVVIKEEINLDSIRKWMEPAKRTLSGKCPDCERDLRGILNHNCPVKKAK